MGPNIHFDKARSAAKIFEFPNMAEEKERVFKALQDSGARFDSTFEALNADMMVRRSDTCLCIFVVERSCMV
jgi:hypothetical protein